MNTFFASAGRTLANVVDTTINASRKTAAETGNAGKSFAAGWKSQRSMNAMKRRYGKCSSSSRSARNSDVVAGLRGFAPASLSWCSRIRLLHQEDAMPTFIPSSEDDLHDPFFAAWFDTWRNAPEDVDPADTFAIYCAF